jgi:hypothetical protein
MQVDAHIILKDILEIVQRKVYTPIGVRDEDSRKVLMQ